MSDADELLRDAQYALQNVSHASSDSKKHAAKAKSLARRIIRKYPNSPEVASARSILQQLGERVAVPTNKFDHVHTTPTEQHQHQFYPKANEYEPSDSRSEGKRNHYALPGWPLRLAQAIPVVVGAFLVLEGIRSFSYAGPGNQQFLSLLAGALLICFPWMNSFSSLVDFAKTRILVEEDWQANANHLPTRQDISELLLAVTRGNKNKLVVLIVVLFFFSGLIMMPAAVFYVIGLRKVFDAIEGWLLNRKKPDAPDMKNDNHETPRDTP